MAPLSFTPHECAFLFAAACNQNHDSAIPDHSQPTTETVLKDETLHSAALNRDIQYHVIIPAKLALNRKYPVLYLLHRGGGNFRDWSNYSDVAARFHDWNQWNSWLPSL